MRLRSSDKRLESSLDAVGGDRREVLRGIGDEYASLGEAGESLPMGDLGMLKVMVGRRVVISSSSCRSSSSSSVVHAESDSYVEVVGDEGLDESGTSSTGLITTVGGGGTIGKVLNGRAVAGVSGVGFHSSREVGTIGVASRMSSSGVSHLVRKDA